MGLPLNATKAREYPTFTPHHTIMTTTTRPTFKPGQKVFSKRYGQAKVFKVIERSNGPWIAIEKSYGKQHHEFFCVRPATLTKEGGPKK